MKKSPGDIRKLVYTVEKQYIRKAVGANIKKIREHRTVTQDSAAKFLGMSTSNYSKIERGILRLHTEDLVLLAQHWNVTIKDFYNGVDDRGEELANHFERTRLKEDIQKMFDETEDLETLRALRHFLRRGRSRKQGRI